MPNRYKEKDEAPIKAEEELVNSTNQKAKRTSGNRVREEVTEETDSKKEQPIHQKQSNRGAADDESRAEEEDINSEEDNTPNEPEESEETQKVSMKKIVRSVIGGDILNGRWIKQQIPLMLLILFFLIIIVSNRYEVESLTKEKIATKDRIDQIREQRIQARSQYQHSIQISTIAEQLDTIGVGIVAEPPYLIEIEK